MEEEEEEEEEEVSIVCDLRCVEGGPCRSGFNCL